MWAFGISRCVRHNGANVTDDSVAAVARACPKLTSINLAGTSLTLNGVAMDENAIANYYSNLDSSPFFQEPALRDLARSKGDSFAFTMDCSFTYAPPEIAAASQSAGS